MLIALNKEKELIQANKDLERESNYYCPACKGKVYVKIGEVKQPHFAHFTKSNCMVFSEGETEEHLKGKQILFEVLEDINKSEQKDLKIEMEAYLPKLKQRPDLLVQSEEKSVAIEFQCSSLSVEDVLKRTEGYWKHSYEVIWILGKNFQYKNRLTSFQKACLYFEEEKEEFQLIHLDVDKRLLKLREQFLLNHHNRLTCKERIIDLNKMTQLRMTNNKNITTTLNSSSFRRHHKGLVKDQYFRRSGSHLFFQLLYQNKENILSIPVELYVVMPNEWLIQTYPFEWKYRFILWLESLPQTRIITEKFLQRWLESEEEKENLHYEIISKLTINKKMSIYIEYFQFLVKANFINRVGDNQWKVNAKLKRYKTLEEKYIFFNSKSL